MPQISILISWELLLPKAHKVQQIWQKKKKNMQ